MPKGSIRLAQLVERQSHELIVVGSSPTTDTIVYCLFNTLTRLAQSVERQPFKLVAVGSSPTSGINVNNVNRRSISCSLMVRIPPFQGGGSGSIPGMRIEEMEESVAPK